MSDYLHIAVGVVRDASGRILISERKQDCVYAGQWEFPGGKLESQEKVEAALVRELDEELGIKVQSARPLICIRYEYPDRKVVLDTWMVTAWQGEAASCEGQRFTWASPADLDSFNMLAANRPIVRAVQLPAAYLFTPPLGGDEVSFLRCLTRSISDDVRCVRLRQPGMPPAEYARLAAASLAVTQSKAVDLMVDDLNLSQELSVGLHLNSQQLHQYHARPVPEGRLLAASCHHERDIQQAQKLGCDFAVLGSVKATQSHPDARPLGWLGFQELVKAAHLPVYALGGMQQSDCEEAWRRGAQGIAAITGLWSKE